ncbi:MAG TPA: DUF2752 domain-containing protein [Tepidisphaeraceae bacterium]|nr:DUF2752 domain-containing protein [Tepidisphaeraceae bacterium]
MDPVVSVPAIYSPRLQRARMSWRERLGALGVASGALAVLGAAWVIHPDPSGVGTHHQLGLDACELLVRTGVPCITCGMTTSFSYFVRGQLLASLYTQPMGTLLAFLAALSVWAGLYIAFTGRPAHRLLRLIPWRYYLIPLFTLAVLGWGWKIAIHVTGHDGWG